MYFRISVDCLSLVIEYSYLPSTNYRRALASYFYLTFNNYINLITNNTLFPQIVIFFLIR